MHSLRKKKKKFVRLLQEKEFHILSSNAVKLRSTCIFHVSPICKISKLFCKSPPQIGNF